MAGGATRLAGEATVPDALATDPYTPGIIPGNVLWASTAFGPEVSTDGGANWRDPDPGEGGAQAFGSAVRVDPNTHKVFASTIGATAMISYDRGADSQPVGPDYAARDPRIAPIERAARRSTAAGSAGSNFWTRTKDIG